MERLENETADGNHNTAGNCQYLQFYRDNAIIPVTAAIKARMRLTIWIPLTKINIQQEAIL